MSGKIILGAQWGDEGKGKFIDIFASQAESVVRSQGGNDAGRTVIVKDEVYKLHVIPSGILYPGRCEYGQSCAGVVVDPKVILEEMEGLRQRGVDLLPSVYRSPRPRHHAVAHSARRAQRRGPRRRGYRDHEKGDRPLLHGQVRAPAACGCTISCPWTILRPRSGASAK